MAILYLCPGRESESWVIPLKRLLPNDEVWVWPDVPDPAKVEVVLAWKQPREELKRYPNLKLISSIGAGVEHLVEDPTLPDGVPIVRIVEDRLTIGMVEYVVLHVLKRHRWVQEMEANQRAKVWKWLPPQDTPTTTVGILGLGALGGATAAVLKQIGFKVVGWSRSPKNVPGIESFHGPDGLKPFLSACAHVASLLPNTPETRGILNAETLAALPRGAHVINAGRGSAIVDADLLAALESGHVSWASLDVFNTEPLPADSPYWTHPRVTVTPHNAADSIAEYVVPTIVENIERLRAGKPLQNLVDRTRGY